MTEFSSYEKKALVEIESWKNRNDGIITKTVDKVVGRLVEFAYSRLTPEAAKLVIEKAIKGFLEMLKDSSYWTFSKSWIVKDARKLGLEVNEINDLCGQDLKILDKLARSRFTVNKIVASLEGAGTGLGGLALILADIPLLFGIAFRTIQEIGTCYGYEMDNPYMSPVIMGILAAGTDSSNAIKEAVLIDMRTAAVMLAKKLPYAKVAEKSLTGLFVKLLKDRSEQIPSLIAKNITKRKVGQVLPGLSAVIGAGFNYKFISDIAYSAYMTFRFMYLSGKYPIGDTTVFGPGSGSSPSHENIIDVDIKPESNVD